MTYAYLFPVLTFITIAGCSTTENACEDITTASEQVQECQLLQRQIANSKDRPLMRTELERRYQMDCVDIRYYRDDKQGAICGNKHKVEDTIHAVKEDVQP